MPTNFFCYPFVVSYQVGELSTEDRSLFFDRLIEAAMSVVLEGVTNKSQESTSVPELPKAPKVANGPKASELKAKVDAEQHALRRMRMCLRDICNRFDINCLIPFIMIGLLFLSTILFPGITNPILSGRAFPCAKHALSYRCILS